MMNILRSLANSRHIKNAMVPHTVGHLITTIRRQLKADAQVVLNVKM